jgi:hypothetical protein
VSDHRATTTSLLDVVWLVGAAPAAAVALAGWCGIGWIRGGPDAVVVAMALALVFLPPVAITLSWPTSRRLAVGGLSLGVWSAILLVTFPLYFPDQRTVAVNRGMMPVERAIEGPVPPVGDFLEVWVPALQGTIPPSELAQAPVIATPPAVEPSAVQPLELVSPAPEADEVILPYEGSGASLVVPVGFEHASEELDVSMIFDTGASFTSVDSATLDRLGMRIPDDAPEVNVRTANGERMMKLVLMDRVWLGGFGVEGVTVAVCDACAHDEEVGLLGLNVSGRFLVTVDQQTRELRLRPRDHTDRLADVRYWVHPAAKATAWPDGRVEVEVMLENHSERAVRGAVVKVGCDEGYEVRMPVVPPGNVGKNQVSLPPGTSCEGYTVELVAAGWG